MPNPKKTKRPTPQRHRWFDHWLVAKGDPLRRLVDRTIAFIDHHERHIESRRRARKPIDQSHHLARIEAVIANLTYAVLNPPETGRLAVNTRHGERGRSRYENPALGKPFRVLLETLESLQFLKIKRAAVIRGEVASIMPTEWFRRRVVEFGVSLADFGRHQAEEVIILTRNTRAQIGSLTATADRKTRERIDYGDTAATRAMRKAVRRLNAFLSSADIAFLDDREAPLVDPYDRVLRRHYVLLPEQTKPRFDQSGRLFGAFWLNMKSQRRSGIRIGGEPVVNLDYGSMFTRLAYADIGTVPPEGDLYAIPELTGYRSGVKMAMNCLLFDNGPRRSWPASMGVGVGTDEDADRGNEDAAVYDARLPAGWGVKRTKQAILRRHPSLAAAWSRQLGYKLMHIESEILMAVLQELMARGIPALGLHDGLMVAASKVEVAKDMMTSKAQQAVGLPIPVSVKFIH